MTKHPLQAAIEFQYFQIASRAETVEAKHWQAKDISEVPAMQPYEIRNSFFEVPIPQKIKELQRITGCNMPWAEEHFQERVGGEPLNPPPSHVRWPYGKGGNEDHLQGGVFSHTYPERFWPGWAGDKQGPEYYRDPPHKGIRYDYGDLSDVVNLLVRDPYTRQAYLPVFFPEDTGAVEGQRVPCTLGYHFMMRDYQLHVWYSIRSCDVVRHFRDDVYMACRLGQWMLKKLRGQFFDEPWIVTEMGNLTFHAYGLHAFAGDMKKLRKDWL